jgi:hypothetical protein
MDKEIEWRKQFVVNLEAMDTPLKNKGKSRMRETKKMIKATKVTTDIDKIKKSAKEKEAIFVRHWQLPCKRCNSIQ